MLNNSIQSTEPNTKELCVFRLGLTSFSTITRELRVVEFFGLHIRDPEEILDHFDVSYVPNKNVNFFRKNSLC